MCRVWKMKDLETHPSNGPTISGATVYRISPDINEIWKLTAVHKSSFKIKIQGKLHSKLSTSCWISPQNTSSLIYVCANICAHFSSYINNICLVIRCTGTCILECLCPQTVLYEFKILFLFFISLDLVYRVINQNKLDLGGSKNRTNAVDINF